MLERIIPGLKKRHLSRAILGRPATAYYMARLQDPHMPITRANLWAGLSSAAAGTMHQLLIENPNPQLDWGLKKHRIRVGMRELTYIYWWMTLYQLILFRTHGSEGYSVEEEFQHLCRTAQGVIEWWCSELNPVGVKIEVPQPWDIAWDRQSPLEAAFGVYDYTMAVMGLDYIHEARLVHVALFKAATESGFNLIQQEVSKYNSDQRMSN